MKRILFVDDEPHVLLGLQRMLRPQRTVWEMIFCGNGSEALEALAERPCDVLVSDMRMPGMSGAQLLAEVARIHPQTVRILLSGQADQASLDAVREITHHFLSKPCDAAHLQQTIAQACKSETA